MRITDNITIYFIDLGQAKRSDFKSINNLALKYLILIKGGFNIASLYYLLKKNLRKILYFFSKRNITFLTKRYLYKVTWGKRNKLMNNEILAEKTIHLNRMWFDIGMPYTKLIHTPLINFSKAPILFEETLTYEKMIKLSTLLVDRISNFNQSVKWNKTLDTNRFDFLWSKLSSSEETFITNKLDLVTLPVTTAHGDLSPLNVLFDAEGNIKIIDWEYYRPHGSVITDILRLHVFFYKLNPGFNGISISSQYDVKEMLNQRIFSSLSSQLGISEEKLALLAAISNTSMNVAQNKDAIIRRVNQFKKSLSRIVP